MPRTVPVSATKNAGDLITGALWNAGPAASNTFLTTVPIAMVYQANVQSFASGFTAVAMDTTILDTDGQHSNSVNNSRVTCQVAGWYSVSGAVGFSTNSSTSRGAVLYKNGSSITQATGNIAAASNVLHVATAGEFLIQLAVGDYVELYAFQNTGAALNSAVSGYSSYLYVRWDHA
jgi:hypothetical protein